MEKEFLTRPDAAIYLTERGLPVAKSTLQKFATTGGGPLYQHFGNRVLYRPADLLYWATERLSGPSRSTSELIEKADSDDNIEHLIINRNS